ncbi:hypothetical protein BJX61DRAFT_544392 [Aspergillus egyptiacus]|nr:hypothetical protein BJX61DRAFT_544392 [Aspergillus egyptiacus]
MQMQLAFRPGGYPTGLDDLRPFYRLGVFIWDTWRMHLMGLVKVARRLPRGAGVGAWPRREGGEEDTEEEKEIIQAPDGSYFSPRFIDSHRLQKRWCALVGRKTGGEKRVQEYMEKLELF